MKCIIVTFNFPLHHIIFAADREGWGRGGVDSQIISSIISYLSIFLILSSIAPHPAGRQALPFAPSLTNLEIELEGRKLEMRAFSFQFIFPMRQFWRRVLYRYNMELPPTWYPSPCDLVTCTPLPPFKPLPTSPCLVSHLFKELYILQTVNFQAKVCHLLLAAGSPGKCR